MKNPKMGDRIRVYGPVWDHSKADTAGTSDSISTGTITCLTSSGRALYYMDDEDKVEYEAAIKQCRKFKPKPKPREFEIGIRYDGTVRAVRQLGHSVGGTLGA